ncbi:hypothetical protein [Sphingopyxis sp. C-1]|nr:hypothetical protein [Sphingopyxis sp. C-1]
MPGTNFWERQVSGASLATRYDLGEALSRRSPELQSAQKKKAAGKAAKFL